MLQMNLFGPGRAQFQNRPLAGFPNHKGFHLLCYLSLNRNQPHNRERLAAVFWSEHSTAISRKYLRDALWRLRQAFQAAGARDEDYLAVTDDTISFVSSSPYWLDVEVFERSILECEDIPGYALSTEQCARLEHAVDLYGGELLEGIYHDWCIHDRERYNLMYFDALSRLMAYHEANGAYERGLTFGERILARDSTREKVQRQMMRLYWLSGSRSAALAQYKRCTQALREVLNVPPMAETLLLYEQMLHNEFNPVISNRNHGAARTVGAFPQRSDESIQLSIDQGLRQIQRLQRMVDETNAELRRLEELIRTTFKKSDSEGKP
jgi:DNA-binding SARP family transcriptional activator